MSRKIFVNIAVKDLAKGVAFFGGLGFEFNKQFTDDTAACMIISAEAFVMLLVEPRFKDFTKKTLVNSTTHTEAILAFSADNREHVDAIADKAISSGGSVANAPMDHGFMYLRSFYDPDGHLWEVMWMDPTHVTK